MPAQDLDPDPPTPEPASDRVQHRPQVAPLIPDRPAPGPPTPIASAPPPSVDEAPPTQVQSTPTPAAPVTRAPTPTPEPTLERVPRIPRASEAPTVIVDREEEDDRGWGVMLTVLIGVGAVLLAFIAIAAGLMWWGGSGEQTTRVAVAEPAPAPVAAPVPAPEPVAVPEPDTEMDTEAPEADTEAPEADAEAPQPEPEPAPTPSPAPAPAPSPRPTPSPTPESVWIQAEPEPPALTSAPLVINSTPAGAEVVVNGRALGNTPFRMTMPPGEYPIQLRLDGYETVTRTANINSASGATIDARLTALARSGPILVTLSGAEGAELLVDGRSVGTLPARIDSITEGEHTFVVRTPAGDQRFTRAVRLRDVGMTVLTLGG